MPLMVGQGHASLTFVWFRVFGGVKERDECVGEVDGFQGRSIYFTGKEFVDFSFPIPHCFMLSGAGEAIIL